VERGRWESQHFQLGSSAPGRREVYKSPPFVPRWNLTYSAPRIVILESCFSLLTNSLYPNIRYKLHTVVCHYTLYLFLVFLCVFAKLRNVTISLVMSFCPSIRPHGATGSHWRIFFKFGIRESSENLSRKFKSH
jgi:hypothetical protein